jgi:hypothetical protein
MTPKDVLLQVANDPILLEIPHWIISWRPGRRDNRLSTINRNNGFVCREKDGCASDVIRFGPEVGLKIALKSIAEALGDSSCLPSNPPVE